MNFKEFNNLPKKEQAERYFSMSIEEQKKLKDELHEEHMKHFKILGGMLGIVKIQTYCILCEKITTGLVLYRNDIFEGYNPDDLMCPNCFRANCERLRQDSALRKIKIIVKLANENSLKCKN